MVDPFSCPHFIPRFWPAGLRSTPQHEPDTWNHDTLLFWRSCKSITSPRFKKWNVQSACSEYIFVLPRAEMLGWKEKKKCFQSEYDECVGARGEWVVCICQRCYYSRQRSYRPISHTIITVISSRSPYNSAQLSTSPWQHKHALTQSTLECLALKNMCPFHCMFLKGRDTQMNHLLHVRVPCTR